jgi:hypothetical protein
MDSLKIKELKDLGIIVSMHSAMLEYLSSGDEPEMPDLDKVSPFHLVPPEAVKRLLAMYWSSPLCTDDDRKALVEGIMDKLQEREVRSSMVRVSVSPAPQVPSGTSITFSSKAPPAPYLPPTAASALTHAEDRKMMDELTKFLTSGAGDDDGVPDPDRPQPSEQSRKKATPQEVKSQTRKMLAKTAQRPWDDNDDDDPVVIPENRLLMCEHWNRSAPDRLMRDLTTYFTKGIKQTKTNVSAIHDLRKSLEQTLPMMIRLSVANPPGSESYVKTSKEINNMMILLHRKRLYAHKGKDAQDQFDCFSKAMDPRLPMEVKAAWLIESGFRLPSPYSMTGLGMGGTVEDGEDA